MDLTVRSISKRFRKQIVLDSVSLSIAPGEVVGFVGPNGAGKTTTMKIAAGLLKPDAGDVRIGDIELRTAPESFLRHVGVLIDSPAMYPTLSAREHLEFLSRMRGALDANRIAATLEMVGFDADSKKAAGKFSTGMKQRLGVAMALLHRPQFLILDEPTNGLDPVAIVETRKLIDKLAKENGMGVLVSSHLLHEVEQVCDRVLFIRGGKLVNERRLDHAAHAYVQIALRTSDNERARELLTSAGIAQAAEIKDANLICRCDASMVIAIAPVLVENGLDLLELRHERETLENVYLLEYAGKREALR